MGACDPDFFYQAAFRTAHTSKLFQHEKNAALSSEDESDPGAQQKRSREVPESTHGTLPAQQGEPDDGLFAHVDPDPGFHRDV